MLNDLLMQNQSRPVALDKLTCSETLSALSVRLLDARLEVVQQTLLCLSTMSRIGEKYIDKLGTVGIDSTVVRLFSEWMPLPTSSINNDSSHDATLLNIIVEVVKLMYVNSAVFAENQRSAIASLILRHSSKLQSTIPLSELVYELTLTDFSICQLFNAGQLHLYLKGVLALNSTDTVDHDDSRQRVELSYNYHRSILSAILLFVLSSVEHSHDEAVSLLLSRLVGWVRFNDDLSRTHDVSSTSCNPSTMLVDCGGETARSGDTSASRAVHIKVNSSYRHTFHGHSKCFVC